MALLGKNVKVEIESSLSASLVVTGVTVADPAVATSASHGLSDGDVVVFKALRGMVSLNGQVARVVNATTDTFELEDFDTSRYSAWTAGTCDKISSWETLGNAQGVSLTDIPPEKVDLTSLRSKTKKYTYGLPNTLDGTINGLYAPE